MIKPFIELLDKTGASYDKNLIIKAYEFAEKAHKGQKRDSGEDYITHPVEVASILADFKPDTASLCAALLHDTMEICNIEPKEIEKNFGAEIAQLVEGLTKTSRITFETREERNAEYLRKMLLATTRDVRIIMIKLADRLHNMRTLKFVNPAKQKLIAEETLQIYAPIAYKIGLYSVKGELEDLCLKYLNPDAYYDLKNRINEKRAEREKKTEDLIITLKEKLQEQKVEFAEVSGRAKHFYSIYKKMIRDKKTIDEISDLIAIRVIVKNTPECYKVIGIAHELWKPVPGRFKDYIIAPKPNGYQSLHTDVIIPTGEILEVQVRTEEMEHISKYGIAAHWRYKETERDKLFDKRIAWLQQILEWKRTTPHEFLESLKVDLFEDEIVVFTPKGDPIILPKDATALDFAYAVHSDIGDHCSKTEVNKKIVALDSGLKGGDIINIITSNKPVASRNWLSIVKTTKAKQKIRVALGIEGEERTQKKEEEHIDVAKFISCNVKGPIKISKCCSPKFQDEIVAFKTKEGVITVHTKNCVNAATIEQSKKVEAVWNVPNQFIKTIYIYVDDEYGLVKSVLDTLIKNNINVLSVNMRPHGERAAIIAKVKMENEKQFDSVKKMLEQTPHVHSVRTEEAES